MTKIAISQPGKKTELVRPFFMDFYDSKRYVEEKGIRN